MADHDVDTQDWICGTNGGLLRSNEPGNKPNHLTVSGSIKEAKPSRRRASARQSMDADNNDFINLLHGSDPVKVELNRLENEVRDKDRELGEAQAEIKALRLSERLREKAVEEFSEELAKVDEKLKLTESSLESKDERKTLDRELARAKVTANRVAVVVANEWKDANDKVMPVKQWLEDRRFLQGEMNQLRDKLAIAERTAKSEAQLKEKHQLRLKVVEEGLRGSSTSLSRTNSEGRSASNGPSRRQSLGGADNMSKFTSNGFLPKRTPSSQLRPSISSGTSLVLKHAKGSSKSFDGGTRSLDRGKVLSNRIGSNYLFNKSIDATRDVEANDTWKGSNEEKLNESSNTETEDSVSGVLYDMLQKEVIALRKAGHEKDQSLKDKDDAIEMLAKKVDTLTKAMEVEAKKMRREVAVMEKEVAAMRVEKDHESRAKRLGSGSSKVVSSSQMNPGRAFVLLLRTILKKEMNLKMHDLSDVEEELFGDKNTSSMNAPAVETRSQAQHKRNRNDGHRDEEQSGHMQAHQQLSNTGKKKVGRPRGTGKKNKGH
ncbi:hypothetical protein IFM89_039714 [Coptis chinensis]|uniref:Uncharacterized protein n=1 Tax=Coptis chinensis TaxID=261450 RepID=A0A835GW32_9MAGN|nr:hypothetical protein IFM89_039714 [Coptis chinensis]